MGKDLLGDRFGRFREIPLSLARRGHEVTGVCLSYVFRDEEEFVDTAASGVNVKWKSINAGRLKIFGLVRFIRQVKQLILETNPDMVWACSDSFYGIVGSWITKNRRSSLVFDLYDNFESYGSTSIPGVRHLYRDAIRSANGVSCVSNTLEDLIKNNYQRTKPTLVLVNGIRKDYFYPRDKIECRKQLGLPLEAKIIGTAGALSDSRGIRSMFTGFEILAGQHGDCHLAIAGPRDNNSKIPTGENIHDLGVLPLHQVPILLCALDVAVISNRESAFGVYCFPQKAYEIIACRIPLIASAVGTMKELFADHSKFLFEPEDSTDFSRAANEQLEEKFIFECNVPSWDDLAIRFEQFLFDISKQQPMSTCRQ